MKVILIISSVPPIGSCLIPHFWTTPRYSSIGCRSGQAREHLTRNNLKEFRSSSRPLDRCRPVFPPQAFLDSIPAKEGLVAEEKLLHSGLISVNTKGKFAFRLPHEGQSLPSVPPQGTNGDLTYVVNVQDIYFRRH